MTRLQQEGSLHFEVLEITNLPTVNEGRGPNIFVRVRLGGATAKLAAPTSTNIIKSHSSHIEFSEQDNNALLLHYPGVDEGEKATISVQVIEPRISGEEIVGTNTVDISKIIQDTDLSNPQYTTVLVRLKEVGPSKSPRGEVKLNLLFGPPQRGIVRLFGYTKNLLHARDAVVTKTLWAGETVFSRVWGYIDRPYNKTKNFAKTNRKLAATGIAASVGFALTALTVLAAIFIPILLTALFTFPLWIIPVSLGALFTSPLWIPVAIFLALSVATIAFVTFVLLATSLPVRNVVYRIFARFRTSPTGKKLLFSPVAHSPYQFHKGGEAVSHDNPADD